MIPKAEQVSTDTKRARCTVGARRYELLSVAVPPTLSSPEWEVCLLYQTGRLLRPLAAVDRGLWYVPGGHEQSLSFLTTLWSGSLEPLSLDRPWASHLPLQDPV